MANRDTDGFFNRVYDMVRQVPCGMVATYGQIARLVGEPRRARYVGYALHVNPEPGIIPCHRIVFADGRLTEGFAFGGPEAHAHCSRTKALPSSPMDMSTCRPLAGQRAWNDISYNQGSKRCPAPLCSQVTFVAAG